MVIPCACELFLYALRNTNKHFWCRCRGIVVIVISEPSSLVYPCVLSFLSKRKKVIPSILFHHEALPSKKIFLLFRTSLRATTIKPIIAPGYKLCPSFGGQAYDHKLSTAGRYPGLS